MSKKTRLFEEHKRLGAKIVDFAGWEMPVQYEGIKKEHLTVRKAAGVFDVSHMGTFEISGPGSADFLDYLTPSDNVNLNDYQAQYSFMLTDKGTFIDDIIIYRIGSEKFLIVVNASNKEKDFNWIKNHLPKTDVSLNDYSERYTLVALQGPKAETILSKITQDNLRTIKPFYMVEIDTASIGKILIARTGYTGEDGFELFCPADAAARLWNTLLEVGRPVGLSPVGLAARDTLRLEMKYTLYGHEIDESTNALEAGLRWVIKFKKPSNFIGKDALLKIKENGLNRKLIGFKMLEKSIPRQGYLIKHNGADVGIVTSGTLSPSLDIPIGIGYIKKDIADVGNKFYVDIRGKERQAEVVKTPFYLKG